MSPRCREAIEVEAGRSSVRESASSDLCRAFERQLAVWKARHADQPDDELLLLCLLALEREENVSVAYHENVLGRRLAAMQLSDGARELIRHALVRMWKDEEGHAVFVREALLDLGRPILSGRTVVHQAAGAVGGWTVSVLQHRRWSQAPLSRGVARLCAWAGAITGRVPREVRSHLEYSSFRDFCRYNIETESTAWMCWQRITELAARTARVACVQVDDCRRIARDEDEHRRVFQILADVLTDGDEIRAGVSADDLSARLEAVDETFVVRSRPRPFVRREADGRRAPRLSPHLRRSGRTT